MAILGPVFLAQPPPPEAFSATPGGRSPSLLWAPLVAEIPSGPSWLCLPYHWTSVSAVGSVHLWVCPALAEPDLSTKAWLELNSTQVGQGQRAPEELWGGLPGRGAILVHDGCCLLPTHSAHLHQLPSEHLPHGLRLGWGRAGQEGAGAGAMRKTGWRQYLVLDGPCVEVVEGEE